MWDYRVIPDEIDPNDLIDDDVDYSDEDLQQYMYNYSDSEDDLEVEINLKPDNNNNINFDNQIGLDDNQVQAARSKGFKVPQPIDVNEKVSSWVSNTTGGPVKSLASVMKDKENKEVQEKLSELGKLREAEEIKMEEKLRIREEKRKARLRGKQDYGSIKDLHSDKKSKGQNSSSSQPQSISRSRNQSWERKASLGSETGSQTEQIKASIIRCASRESLNSLQSDSSHQSTARRIATPEQHREILRLLKNHQRYYPVDETKMTSQVFSTNERRKLKLRHRTDLEPIVEKPVGWFVQPSQRSQYVSSMQGDFQNRPEQTVTTAPSYNNQQNQNKSKQHNQHNQNN